MKTTVEIADPLFREAKRVASESGTTLRELIELGLRKVLDDRNAARRTPFKLRDASNRAAKPVPGVDLSNWADIRDNYIYPVDKDGRLK